MLATPAAVVAGIAYNFLPFMTLPIYVVAREDRRPARRGGRRTCTRGRGDRAARSPAAIVGGLVGAGLAASRLGYDVARRSASSAALVGALVGTFFVSQSFLRVVLPLSLPGVFAGSLLTFIPAMGDFVNAELLGNTQTRMIGNVIQSRFLEINDYPTAAALSFILMAAILVDGRDLRPGPRHRRADRAPR